MPKVRKDPTRESWIARACLVPEMCHLGFAVHRSADMRSLGPHQHPEAFEVCLIAGGSVEWRVGDEVYEIEPGSIYVTKPGEEHGGVDAVLHPCELYWRQFADGDADRHALRFFDKPVFRNRIQEAHGHDAGGVP